MNLQARMLGLVPLVAFLLILNALWDDGDVDILGVDVPIWLVAFASYLLGAVAMWLTVRQRPSR